MKQSVIIKSFPNGIVLHLSEADTFEEILQETAIRFRESRDFFKDAKMALSIKGRKLTEEEENTLLNIKILSTIAKTAENGARFLL